MYEIEVSDTLERILDKLLRKDKVLYEAVVNKFVEIAASVDLDHYKNLKHPMNAYKRVHVGSSFVLIFKVDHNRHLILFHNLRHHDDIYQW